MVKGVNKQIIEINGSEEDYFDKVILFVKPERHFITQKGLERQAKSYVGKLGKKPMEQKLKLSQAYLKYILSAFLGACAMWIAMAVLI